MAPATASPVRAIGKPGAEGLPSPVALAGLAAPQLPCEAADNSSEHSSSDVAMPGEVLPRAHSSYRTASGGLAAPLPGQPHHPHVGLEEQEPLRITVDAKERLRWSPALHQRFCQAVAELGGSALAKPKDIVAKMRVVGLTLAHVKSHLQKYRLSEGVTCVPNGARGHAASLRRMHQQLAPLPPMGLSGGSVDTELGAPAAKRARSSPTALASPALMAASSGVWPPLPAMPHSSEALPAFLAGLGPSDAGVPVLLPQPVGLPLPPLPLPSLPAPAASAPTQPEQPEGLDKLLELAELAAAQHDELHSLELGASSDLDTLGQQLAASAGAAAALPPQQQQGTCLPEMAARVAALQEQQAQLKAALAAHTQQHARLTEQLADFRRSVAEVLSSLPHQVLTPTQLQQVQCQQQRGAAAQLVKTEPAGEQAEQDNLGSQAAVASAVLQAVAQHSMAAGAALPGSAAEAAAASPHIASLIALIAPAANSGAVPAPAHLQQLMLHAAQLAGARPRA